MLILLSTVACCATAVTFQNSMVAKASGFGSVGAMVRGLGVPQNFAALVSVLLVSAEGVLGFGVLIPTLHTFAGVMVAGLGAIFAGSGIRARALSERIECACFGLGRTRLGVRQVLQAPGFAAVAIVLILSRPAFGYPDVPLLLAGSAICVAITWAIRSTVAARRAAGDRRALSDSTSESTGVVV